MTGRITAGKRDIDPAPRAVWISRRPELRMVTRM
jgi:hypothetical protein